MMEVTTYSSPASKNGQKLQPATIVLKNSIFGNYMAASRRIEKDELVLEEIPLISCASGTDSPCKPFWNEAESHDVLPICLSCGKHIDAEAVCSKCKWPVCDKICENDPLHSKAECLVFAKRQVLLPEQFTLSHYSAIYVLRTFLICAKHSEDVIIFQNMEDHHERRHNSSVDLRELDFVTNFLRKTCQLTEYKRNAIDQIMGTLIINSYWVYPYIGRYISVVFDKASLFAHDCEPNSSKKFVEKEAILDGVKQKVIVLQIHATRVIDPYEPITISYIPICHGSMSVSERQQYLKTYFYFQCQCKRCRTELKGIDENLNGYN